jgi:hypothetical protein
LGEKEIVTGTIYWRRSYTLLLTLNLI